MCSIQIRHKPIREECQRQKTMEPVRLRASRRTTHTTVSDILQLMDSLYLPIDLEMYSSLVEECTSARDTRGASELHAHIRRSGLCPALPLHNRLVLMYVSCGLLQNAYELFRKMTVKDYNSWAILIVGCFTNGLFEEAIHMFLTAINESNILIKFPSWTVACFLKGCLQLENLELGKQVHCRLLKAGYGSDLCLCNTLINFYGKLGCLGEANSIFNQMSCHDTASHTAQFVNNCAKDHFQEAINAFKEMARAGIKMNDFSYSSILRVCCRMDANAKCGQQIHAKAIKQGMELKPSVQHGLVVMYAKCGLLKDAERMFELISNRNTAPWNAMLIGYLRHGYHVEAVKFLYKMKEHGFLPTHSLVNQVRIACGGDIS